MALEFADLERIYEALAETLDTVDEAEQPVLLAKLVLLLARDAADAGHVLTRIAEARRHLTD